MFNKIKGVCEGTKEKPKSGRGDILHGSVITPKDIKNFFNGLGNETNKLINSSLKYTGEVIKGIGKFIDKNLDTIGKVAITIGGAAVAVGAAVLAIGAMPVLIPVGAGTIITGTMIAKGAIVVAGTSALVAATVGGAQTITGLLQKDLAGNIISVEESNNKILNGITNLVGSAMLAGSTYMLNSVYNSITAETVENKIESKNNANKDIILNDEGKLQDTQSNTSSGQWVKVNESMSETSRKYQTQITGHTNETWIQNGVKFDGYKDGVLIDAKANYNHFINENTGD